jgi:hypothetical protein
MYRRTGIVLLLIGAVLALLLLWLPVRYFTGYSVSGDQIGKIYVPCGSTVGILADRFDPAVERPGERSECTKRAWGRVVYLVVFVGPLVAFGLYGFFRGPRPHRRLRE